MPACEVLGKIHTELHSNPQATSEQLHLVQQIMNQWYSPSSIDAEMYFYDYKMDQHHSGHLGVDPISDTLIMMSALQAFGKEHHGKQLQRIE